MSYFFSTSNSDLLKEKQIFITEVDDTLGEVVVACNVKISANARRKISETCEWDDVEYLLIRKGGDLFDLHNGEEFILLNDDMTLALISTMEFEKGQCVICLNSVIRKVKYIDEIGTAHYKQLGIRPTARII